MKKSLPGQLVLADPLKLTLRHAYEKYHRRASHATSYVKAASTALSHWERCTSNPSIGEVDNATMREFSLAFMRLPLPSKVQTLLRRATKGDKPSLALLSSIGCPWSKLSKLDADEAYEAICNGRTIPLELLPTNVTFNAQARTIEAMFSTFGPKHRGNRYALGLLTDVPCCRPEDEDEPEVVTAQEDDLNLIYCHCDVATWPSEATTGVPPPILWRALFVYLYNVASRRGDFLRLEKARVKLDLGVILSKQKKSGKYRAVPINTTVVEHLRPIFETPGELMFPFPKNKRDLYKTWYKIQDAAGILVERSDLRKRMQYYGFHEIRKTSLGEYFAINEHSAQEMGAHSDMATTLKHYIPAIKKDGKLRKTVDALPQPSSFHASQYDDLPPSSPVSTPPDRPRLRIVG